MAIFKNTMLLATSLAVFSGISSANTPADMGDVNEDEMINVLDIVIVVNEILN